MVGVKMSKNNICYILGLVTPGSKTCNKPFAIMKVNMPEKLLILLVAPACIDKYNATACFNYQGTQREDNKITVVGGINPRPQGFWHNAKHCASVDPETGNIEKIEFHLLTARFRNN
jgi:hypothetical protein